jgi:hypothetical protein
MSTKVCTIIDAPNVTKAVKELYSHTEIVASFKKEIGSRDDGPARFPVTYADTVFSKKADGEKCLTGSDITRIAIDTYWVWVLAEVVYNKAPISKVATDALSFVLSVTSSDPIKALSALFPGFVPTTETHIAHAIMGAVHSFILARLRASPNITLEHKQLGISLDQMTDLLLDDTVVNVGAPGGGGGHGGGGGGGGHGGGGGGGGFHGGGGGGHGGFHGGPGFRGYGGGFGRYPYWGAYPYYYACPPGYYRTIYGCQPYIGVQSNGKPTLISRRVQPSYNSLYAVLATFSKQYANAFREFEALCRDLALKNVLSSSDAIPASFNLPLHFPASTDNLLNLTYLITNLYWHYWIIVFLHVIHEAENAPNHTPETILAAKNKMVYEAMFGNMSRWIRRLEWDTDNYNWRIDPTQVAKLGEITAKELKYWVVNAEHTLHSVCRKYAELTSDILNFPDNPLSTPPVVENVMLFDGVYTSLRIADAAEDDKITGEHTADLIGMPVTKPESNPLTVPRLEAGALYGAVEELKNDPHIALDLTFQEVRSRVSAAIEGGLIKSTVPPLKLPLTLPARIHMQPDTILEYIDLGEVLFWVSYAIRFLSMTEAERDSMSLYNELAYGPASRWYNKVQDLRVEINKNAAAPLARYWRFIAESFLLRTRHMVQTLIVTPNTPDLLAVHIKKIRAAAYEFDHSDASHAADHDSPPRKADGDQLIGPRFGFGPGFGLGLLAAAPLAMAGGALAGAAMSPYGYGYGYNPYGYGYGYPPPPPPGYMPPPPQPQPSPPPPVGEQYGATEYLGVRLHRLSKTAHKILQDALKLTTFKAELKIAEDRLSNLGYTDERIRMSNALLNETQAGWRIVGYLTDAAYREIATQLIQAYLFVVTMVNIKDTPEGTAEISGATTDTNRKLIALTSKKEINSQLMELARQFDRVRIPDDAGSVKKVSEAAKGLIQNILHDTQ